MGGQGVWRIAIVAIITFYVCANRLAQAEGSDVILGELGAPEIYAQDGDILSLSFTTISCNAGTKDLEWIDLPSNKHPVIAQNLYRLFNGRMEQIGHAWVKHGFVALQGNVCRHSEDPEFPHETCPGGPPQNKLQVGCSDPYNAQINEGPELGARNAIDPLSGHYAETLEHTNHNHSHPLKIEHGVQVNDADLGLSDEGARYFVEGQYIAPDDAIAGNGLNNVSYREIQVRQVAGAWRFGITGSRTIRRTPAIRAWEGAEFSDIHVVEDVIGDRALTAHLIVAQRVTNLQGTTHRYEYAVYNMNSKRAIKSFSIPIGNLSVTNMGFRSPKQHVEDALPAPWTTKVDNGKITWTAAPPEAMQKSSDLAWGMTYNFWFDAPAGPTRSIATLVPARPGLGGDVYTTNVLAPAESAASIGVSQPDAFIKHLLAELDRERAKNSGDLVPFSVGTAPTPYIAPGSESEARAYYARISQKLNFSVDGSNLTQLLMYLGYEGLTADDIELIDPETLMPQTPEEFVRLSGVVTNQARFDQNLSPDHFKDGQVLATRFLAPKIADLSKQPPYQAGWRKLVRLKVRADSPARQAGIAESYILFNYLRDQAEAEPFPGPGSNENVASKNNQVILVPSQTSTGHTDAAYWMVFGSRGEGYPSILYLSAAFDFPFDPEADNRYYVPTACAECHGHSGDTSDANGFPQAKLNFLDTDHWHDRARPGDYFEQAGSTAGVLHDGGKDENSPDYARAFDVVRSLNEEIIKQNENTDATLKSNQLLGAQKWWELHSSSTAHAEPLARALQTGQSKWNATDPNDAKLLGLLNKYCYRCHSSVAYNVFDREQVLQRKRFMALFVRQKFMPQGQDIERNENADWQALQEYLNNLQ